MAGDDTPHHLHYDYRDIFIAPRLALSGKKILGHFIGLVIGYGGYVFFTYLALISLGESFDAVWANFGLAPYLPLEDVPWFGALLAVLGLLWLLLAWLVSSFTVAKVTFEELRGNLFYSLREGWAFARTNLKKLFAPFFFSVLFVVALLLLLVFAGLFSRIPWLGELSFSLFFLVPLFAFAAVVVVTLVGLAMGVLLLPAAVVAEEKGSFEATAHLFSLLWRQPWRWSLYTGLSGLLAKVATFVFGYACFRAAGLVADLASLLGGDKIDFLIDKALEYLPAEANLVLFFSTLFPGLDFGFHLPIAEGTPDLPVVQEIAGLVLGLGFVTLFLAVVAYGLAILSSGQLLTYLSLRHKQGVDLLQPRET